MMNKTKTILICQYPLPYDKIGSWTNMYNYLLLDKNHNFDYIICPVGSGEAENVEYRFIRNVNFLDKIKSKLINDSFRFSNYFEALTSIVDNECKYLIHIIDNSGIVVPLDNFLKNKYSRSNFFIQYYYQGFSPLFLKEKAAGFLYGIDEIIFLTELSYMEYLRYYDDCPFKVRILNNAVDVKQFKIISHENRNLLKTSLGFDKNQIVFLWCSQDRIKKGLHIVLSAFREIYKVHGDKVKLLIVGIDRHINQEGVQVIGRVPNKELAKYYQISDVYLFPSLWKEGFGIVLAEALNCGCYIIASAQGGIPEVLNNGEYGVLINRPNIVEDWLLEMNRAISLIAKNNGNPFFYKVPKSIYNLDEWATKLKDIIETSKSEI